MSKGCCHLAPHLNRGGSGIRSNYLKLLNIVFPINRKLALVKFGMRTCCSGKCKRPAHLLLTCVFCNTVGCVDHILDHLLDEEYNEQPLQPPHGFAISLEYGHVYCGECEDFVYDAGLEARRTQAQDLYYRYLGLPRCTQWTPNPQEIEYIPLMPESNVANHNLRGLVNLGNTCFMNTIIQALVHTPSMRDYFLTDQHAHAVPPAKNACLMCLISETFQELVQPAWVEPVVPRELLQSLWSSSTHLAGYHQQDAHEFLITLLERLHIHSKPPESPVTQSVDCKCVIDKLFAGQMQSDLRCVNCGHSSTRVDPFLDIALNVPDVSSEKENQPVTLENCLDRYVLRELVTCTRCEYCGMRGLTKQLTFRKLPVVVVFQLKRFEHAGAVRKKITSVVDFPIQLDMTRYLSAYHADASLFDPVVRGSQAALSRHYNQYDLHAVVQHVGSLDTGHYTCFVRRGEQWFKCDDDYVCKVSEKDVFRSEGYLLFYQTSSLKYQNNFDSAV